MKALIFTTHTGGGHDAAAEAIARALEEMGVVCKVMDCVAFAGEWVSKVVSGSYVKMVQHSPNSFGRMYHVSEMMSTPRMKSPVYMMNSAYAFRMAKEIRSFGADMIVCTHEFGGHSVTHLKRHGDYAGLLAMILTDYTVHPFMEDVQADVVCLSHRGLVKDCLDKCMPQSVLYPFGIPVSPACRPCTDKRAAKIAAGLDPEKKEVLMVGGSMGAGNLPGTITAALAAMGENAHLTVVCGSNEKIRQKCETLCTGDSRVTVCGRVSPLHPLMAAADVLLTKSGGLTTTEAMTVGTPMVIAHPIRGCETANADFFEQRGLAAYARSMEEITDKLHQLLNDDAAREAMIAAQRREIDPDAARKLAACLVKLTGERMASIE
ncbi:MAG: glycosyltransferase [Clostridia bacterium]|nr:glycosyltransferase [Clostridia bacterium]